MKKRGQLEHRAQRMEEVMIHGQLTLDDTQNRKKW